MFEMKVETRQKKSFSRISVAIDYTKQPIISAADCLWTKTLSC